MCCFILLNYSPQGLWFWGVGGMFIFDSINSLIDAYFEKESRKMDGGLERLEYIIHIFGATGMVIIIMSYFISGWENQYLESKLALVDRGFSLPFVIQGWAVAIGSGALAFYETVILTKNYRTLKN